MLPTLSKGVVVSLDEPACVAVIREYVSQHGIDQRPVRGELETTCASRTVLQSERTEAWAGFRRLSR